MNRPQVRPGAAAVEAAVVLPLVFLLVVGIIAGGMLVFRQQQVTCLAREGARWASVRGGDYQKETDRPCPTGEQIAAAAIAPRAAGMRAADIDVTVEWIDRGTNTVWAWDAAPKDVRSVAPSGEYVTNTVRVTVAYRSPAPLFGGQMTVRSVCELPMAQ